MPKFEVVRRTAHAASDMFDLVADIERYPEFLPLCEKLKLRSKSREGDREVLISDMTVGYKSFRETFSTRVILDRPADIIDFSYLTGPFRRLAGRWRFEAKGPADCVVYFSVEYEFRSRILGALMGAVFDRAFRRFSAAFEERADRIYGPSARPASTSA